MIAMAAAELTDAEFEAIVLACDGDTDAAICAVESPPWEPWVWEAIASAGKQAA